MTVVNLDKDKARDLTIFLGRRNEERLTLVEMLADPVRYSEEWKAVYYLLTGSRLETNSEKKFGAMIDRYMSGDLK